MKKLFRRSTQGGRIFGLLPVLALVAAFAVAGCGGSSASGETSASSSSSAETAAPQGSGPGGFAKMSEEDRQCLKEQGIEPPQGGEGPPAGFGEGKPPVGGPGGAGGGKFREAFEACGIEGPPGRPGGPGGAGGPGAPPNGNSSG
jgi:hypothetical protein